LGDGAEAWVLQKDLTAKTGRRKGICAIEAYKEKGISMAGAKYETY
jgi:hypothetical protein